MLKKPAITKFISVVAIVIIFIASMSLMGCTSKMQDLSVNANSLKKTQSPVENDYKEQTLLLTNSSGKAIVLTFKASDNTMLQNASDVFASSTAELVIDGIITGEISIAYDSYTQEVEQQTAFDDTSKEGIFFGLEGIATTPDFDTSIADRTYPVKYLYTLKCDNDTTVTIRLGDVDVADIENRLKISVPDSSFGQGGDIKETNVVYAVNDGDSDSPKLQFTLNSDDGWNIIDNAYLVPTITYNGSEVATLAIREPKRYKTLEKDLHSSGTYEEGEFFSCPGEKAVVDVIGSNAKEIRYLVNVDSVGVVDLRCPEWAADTLEKILTVKHI